MSKFEMVTDKQRASTDHKRKFVQSNECDVIAGLWCHLATFAHTCDFMEIARESSSRLQLTGHQGQGSDWSFLIFTLIFIGDINGPDTRITLNVFLVKAVIICNEAIPTQTEPVKISRVWVMSSYRK
jgi:hypothetical protein